MIVRFKIHTFSYGKGGGVINNERDFTAIRDWPAVPAVGENVKLSFMSQSEQVHGVSFDDNGVPTMLLSIHNDHVDASITGNTEP